MANTFIKATQVVQAAALLLEREIVLPRTVWTQPSSGFIGAYQDTITLRVPAVLDATTRTLRASAALTPDDLTETTVPVVLDKHPHSLLNITDEQLTLDISDFAAQVLRPQMRAVAEAVEDIIAAELAAANVAGGQELDEVDTSSPPNSGEAFGVAVQARKVLNDLNVPRSQRYLVLGSDLEAWFLQDPVVVNHNSGNRDALEDATIGRIAGFTILGSNAVDAAAGYAYHQTAIAFGNVAPQIPEGASMGARVTADSFALRYLRDYNPTNSTGPVDRSLVDCFAGAASVEQGGNNNRLVVLSSNGS